MRKNKRISRGGHLEWLLAKQARVNGKEACVCILALCGYLIK